MHMDLHTSTNRNDGWVKSLEFLPKVTSEQIDEKLIGGSTLPKRISAPQAFRNKRLGYRLWKEGFVRSISVRPNVKGQCLLFLVKSRVHASMKNTFYNVYAHLNQTSGDVKYAKCNCKAGQGGCCKHVAALLFTLLDFVNLDAKVVPNDLTCTQVSQKWHVPASANMTLPKAVRFEDLEFEKAEVHKKRKRPVVTGVRESFCATPPFAYKKGADDLKRLAENLSKAGKAILFCEAIKSNSYEPCTSFQTSVSRQISKQREPISNDNEANAENSIIVRFFGQMNFSLDATAFQNDELKTKILRVVEVSKQEANNICVNTLGQSTLSQWFQERKVRLTASAFGKVMNRRQSVYPNSLIKCIVDKTSRKSNNMPASLKWGINNEKVAISKYENHEDLCGKKVEDCGFVVFPSCPWLGCSPDGIVVENGALVGCTEVKCPYAKRDFTLKEAAKDKNFFLQEKDYGLFLKRSHFYYYQCQGVVNILELPWIDFVVYTQSDLHIERIFRDTALWNERMLPELTAFYKLYIFPELMKN